MSLATQSSMAAASGNSSLNSFSIGPISVESTYERVPFQTLIDKGLEYMRRYPPRCLLKLAQKYHRDQWQIDMASMSSISLLQDPPSWSLAGTTKADWVLKQRVRQDLGMSTTSRKDRRLKSRHSPKNNDDKSSTPSAEEEATPSPNNGFPPSPLNKLSDATCPSSRLKQIAKKPHFKTRSKL